MNSQDLSTDVSSNGSEPSVIFDGLCVIGKLVQLIPLRSTKTGKELDGMMNAVVSTSRGDVRLSLMRTGRTMMGSFDLAAFDILTDRDAIGKDWVITVGEETRNGFVSFIAINAKRF